MRLVAGWSTDVGHARAGKTNEDSFLVDDHLGLFAVADGVGGHRGGEVASTTAIETLRAAFGGGATIDAAIRAANNAVFERAEHDPALLGMGTTMTAVVPASDDELLIGHAGDSRAYLLRDDRLQQITYDHSLVEELVREGRITAEQAAVHPHRNIITRALGVEPRIDVDLYTVRVRSHDRLMLCSDGLTTMVRDADIIAAMSSGVDPQSCAERLVDRALENGGDDNVTVVIIDVQDVAATAETRDPTSQPTGATTEMRTTAIRTSPMSTTRHDEIVEGVAALDAVDVLRDEVRWRPSLRSLRYLILAVVPFVLLFGAAGAWLRYVNDHKWYVGSDRVGVIVMYEGSPDAPLGWKPRVVAKNTDALLSDIHDQSIHDQILGNKLCRSTDKPTTRSCYNHAVAAARASATATTTTSPPPPTSTVPSTTQPPTPQPSSTQPSATSHT